MVEHFLTSLVHGPHLQKAKQPPLIKLPVQIIISKKRSREKRTRKIQLTKKSRSTTGPRFLFFSINPSRLGLVQPSRHELIHEFAYL